MNSDSFKNFAGRVNEKIARIEKWDRRFLDMAFQIATFSKDPSTKCGAVLVRPNLTVASVGYNGFPRGCSDDPALYADREQKYARVVHAEVNAIIACMEQAEGYTMYSTLEPCERCAAVVIQAGVRRLVHARVDEKAYERWMKSWNLARQMYREAGVEVVAYDVGAGSTTEGGQGAAVSGRDGGGEQGQAGNA